MEICARQVKNSRRAKCQIFYTLPNGVHTKKIFAVKRREINIYAQKRVHSAFAIHL